MEVFVLIERKSSTLRKAIAWICLVAAVASVVLMCVNKYAFISAVIFGFLWYWLLFKSEFEYEYSYFDGDFRFAKVIDKSRRKSLGSYGIDDLIIIAPAGDSDVTHYENNKEIPVKDYTSGNPDVPYYDVIVRDSKTNKALLIKAELDDEYLDAVCIKHRSKVIRRRY